jgi:hypothetical protein
MEKDPQDLKPDGKQKNRLADEQWRCSEHDQSEWVCVKNRTGSLTFHIKKHKNLENEKESET